MPDDSSPDFQHAQRRHGDKIRVERELMEMTGLSRSQIREGLREFSQKFTAQSAPPSRTEGVTPFVNPEIKVTTTEFTPRPLTLGQDNKGADAGPSGASGTPIQVTLCQNGVLTLFEFLGRSLGAV